jgi:predicted RNase H-like HicB family nuclease
MLPGCITWGKMRNEAVEMAEDAIEAWVLTALRFGDEIPEVDGCVLQYAVDEPVRATPLDGQTSSREASGGHPKVAPAWV